jgi:hypothetical protein
MKYRYYSDIIGNKTIKPHQPQKKCDVEGENTVHERMVQRWFKRFTSGNLEMNSVRGDHRFGIVRRT